MMILEFIFGFLLVFAGRYLFWLCVGTIGFLIGVQCAVSLGFPNGWTTWVSAFALGSIGIVLAMSFEWITVIFGVGFLGGGYLLIKIFPSIVQEDPYAWLIFVVGGIVGMCLMVIAFDWALILISSLLGATLIVDSFHVGGGLREFLFICSVLSGILVQFLALKDAPDRAHHSRKPASHHRHYAGSGKET